MIWSTNWTTLTCKHVLLFYLLKLVAFGANVFVEVLSVRLGFLESSPRIIWNVEVAVAVAALKTDR